MEGIFGSAASPAPSHKTTGADRVRSIVRGHASRRRAAGLLTPVLAICGLLLAGGLVWMITPATQQAPAPILARATPPVVAAQRPQSPPQALLAQTGPAPAAAAAIPASGPASAPTSGSASGPISAPAPDDASKRASDAASVKPKKPAAAQKEGSDRKIEPVAEASNRCARMGRRARARCMRPHILRADREMRAAYASATRAGVDRRTLKSYRNRWSRVLEESNSDPVYVTASLEEMTRRLHAKRARL